MFWIQSFYPVNMNFIIRRNCFPQSYYSGFKVIIPDSKFLLWIQSYYSGFKVFTLDPKLLLRNQSYYPENKDPIQFNIPSVEYEHVTSSSPFNMAVGVGRKRRPKTQDPKTKSPSKSLVNS